MKRHPALFILGIAGLIGFPSCATDEAPHVQEYLLRAKDARTDRPSGGTLDSRVVRIARVDRAAHLNGIVIVREDGRADTLVYHRFAAPVEDRKSVV